MVRLCLFIALAACLPARRAVAQAQYVGRPIQSVQVAITTGDKADEELLGLVETQAGETLSIAMLRESIVHLMALGRFDDVQVDATLTAGGVSLVYRCVPRRTVARLLFRGALGLPDSELRSTVVERYSTSPPLSRADDIAVTLADFYRERGFAEARITPRVETGTRPNLVSLVFDVRAGPQARIGTVAVEGDFGMTPGDLIRRLQLGRGQPYDRVAIDGRAGELVDSLQRKGYYEARLGVSAQMAAGVPAANVTVTGGRGPIVTVEVQGVTLSKRRREELVPVRREGSVDEDLLEDSARNLEDDLRAQGYRDARAAYERKETEARLTILFTVVKGPRYRVAAVELPPRASIPLPPMQTVRGGWFVQSRLDGDVGRIAELYRSAGFRAVKVQAAIENGAPEASRLPGGETEVPVAVRVVTVEGARTAVRAVDIEGNQALSKDALMRGVGLKAGDPYDPVRVAAAADAILQRYLNDGYQTATVTPSPPPAEGETSADVRLVVNEGPQIVVDRVLVVGNTRTRARTIEREMGLRRGQPLGSDDIAEGQLRLSSLGLFRRVRVTPLTQTTDTARDVLVTVEEAPATTVAYGAGLEGGRRLRGEVDAAGRPVESFELAPRGSFEIGRRNLWGKNRSLDLFTRFSVRSKDLVQAQPGGEQEGGGIGFREYRVQGAYREPRVVGNAGDAVLTVYAEQAVRSAFNFNRRGASASLVYRFTPRVTVTGRYNIERTRLFNVRVSESQEILIQRLYSPVRLSSFSSSVVHDTRGDPFEPQRGALLSVDGELAARSIGSEVGLVKTYLQGFLYRRLPGARGIVVAGGGRLGLATGFAREVTTDGPDGQRVTTTVRDIPASERFFAGGDTTVRGFALDRLGTDATLDVNGVPKGGQGLVIFNAELRVPLVSQFSAVAFLDVGNVFARASDIDLGDLRSGAGFGLRWRSPLGPVRVDMGFKLNRREFPSGARERAYVLHVGIGQAF